jgi:hypothetical protein
MAIFTMMAILFCSYVHQVKVDDNKKVVCTAVCILVYVCIILFTVLFGG